MNDYVFVRLVTSKETYWLLHRRMEDSFSVWFRDLQKKKGDAAAEQLIADEHALIALQKASPFRFDKLSKSQTDELVSRKAKSWVDDSIQSFSKLANALSQKNLSGIVAVGELQ